MTEWVQTGLMWLGGAAVLVGAFIALRWAFVGAVEEAARPMVREQREYAREEVKLKLDSQWGTTMRLVDNLKGTIDRNAEQHNKLADLVGTVVGDVREAGEQVVREVREAAQEAEKRHLSGVKGHLDTLRRDVQALERQVELKTGPASNIPSRGWIERLERDTAHHAGIVQRNERQQNADRLRIEKLETQLATLEREMQASFDKVGEDIQQIVSVVNHWQAQQAAPAKRRPKRSTRA